jgi:transcriptional regulator with XRE-family HTH domain
MKLLSDEQLAALRTAPLGRLSNRLSIAFAMADVKHANACDATGLTASDISKLARGAYQSLDVEKARKMADYFGCSIEDLFPPREQAVAS